MLIDTCDFPEATEPETSIGCLSVLNVGAGDLKFTFDKGNAIEADRAKRVIADMLARGYVIFVETPEGLRRATGFDPDREVYILTDVPGTPERVAPADPALIEPPADLSQLPKRRGRPPKLEMTIPMKSTKATALAPTAGG
jgi:hypothetical protein